jgi:hypothetical protein
MPKEIIHNIATGEVTERELTDEEVAALDAAEVERDKDLTNIRGERDGNLAASDWTQMADSPLSNSKKAEWATYRQELRDFPDGKTKQSEFTKDSDDRIVWPTQPS